MSDKPKLIDGLRFYGLRRGDAIRDFRPHISVDALLHLGKPIRTAIDIGAHIGLVALPLAAKGVTVYCFEPDPTNFRFLWRNIGYNRFRLRIHPIPLGVHADRVFLTMSLRRAGTNSGMVSPLYRSDRKVVGAARFLNINDALDVVDGSIDYLKIDMEGMEHSIIPRISKANWRRIRILDLEIHRVGGRWRTLYGDIKVFPIRAYLREQGFRLLRNTHRCVWSHEL